MADLLLELFSEEIPARMQARAVADLGSLFKSYTGFSDKEILYFSTPRRIAVIVKDLPLEEAASENELKGPKVGAPEIAIQGFLKKNTLTQNDLTQRDGVYFAVVKKEGRQTTELLKTAIEAILMQFPWPKSMRWGSGDASWVRPLHSILCILDGEIIPVSFAGVTASNTTRGHRFLSPDAITITSPSDYERALETASVIVDRDKRKECIAKQAQKIAGEKGLKLIPDVLEEVTGLVEYPVVLAGNIDAKFMDLPKEVLVSEMRAHQKYFALENKDGTLSDTFLITSNMKTDDQGKSIIAGNERVLRARLSDGRFFWDQDRKKTLDAWGEGLKNVTFHTKLGTIADKVGRVKTLGVQLANYVPDANTLLVERAAHLCKADLVTGMVGEFPELQGVMGRYYALEHEDPAVADAIRDHYKPQGPTDSVPTYPVSICVALADKLDTLISMFAIGEKPTGSKDPFALRRAALGVIKIILENKLRIPLKQFISEELLSFFYDRFIVQLKENGVADGIIRAVIAGNDDDLERMSELVADLNAFMRLEDGINLLAAYKRATNILSIEEKKDNVIYSAGALDKNLLEIKEEIELADILVQKSVEIEEFRRHEKFAAAIEALAKLRKPVDHFFDKVMVNCENKALREERLRLLATIRDTMNAIANFTLIEG